MTIRPYTGLYRSEVLAIEQRLGLEACGEWSDVHEEAINAFRRRHQMELCYGMDLATEQALESIVVTAETLMRPVTPVQVAEDDVFITPNFRWCEFESTGDGVAVPKIYRANVRALCQQLEIVRRILGNRRIKIVSGWRSVWWNQRLGGYEFSAHKEGLAADFTVEGLQPSSVRRLMESLMERGELYDGGLGRMSQFTHYDIAQQHERWN